MALARSKYGIEYNPSAADRNRSSGGTGWFVVLALAAAAVSFAAVTVRKFRNRPAADVPKPPAAAVHARTPGENAAPPAKPAISLSDDQLVRRSGTLRSLLLRLNNATNLEMQVSTIESIRALPGEPAADLDDELVRRLGELNLRRLYECANPQWVREVEVRHGDTAARIAAEHGSTLASMVRLNRWSNANMLRAGAKVKVMHHPRWRFVSHKAPATAELWLNGKLFKRYYLKREPGGNLPRGEDRTGTSFREFCRRADLVFEPGDAAEIAALLPSGTPAIVAEY